MTSGEIPLSELPKVIKANLKRDMRERFEIAMSEFEQSYKVLLQESFQSGDGEAGGAGGVVHQIREGVDVMLGTIGFTPQAKYMLNYELGERGTEGGTGQFKRTRMPPIKDILKWVLKSGLKIDGVSDKPYKNADGKFKKGGKAAFKADRQAGATSFAWGIAIKRKKFGRPAMNIIAKAFKEKKDRIQQILSGQV